MAPLFSSLNKLNDTEFSFIYLEQYARLPSAERLQLDEERAKRKLDHLHMRVLVNSVEYKLTNTGCVRCNTTRSLVNNQCQICRHTYRSYKKLKWYQYLPFDFLGVLILEIITGIV